MTQANSMREWQDREEQMERRAEALARRFRRQQFALFELESEADFPECPNCGEHAAPVFAVSRDASAGYYEEEQGCALCARGSN